MYKETWTKYIYVYTNQATNTISLHSKDMTSVSGKSQDFRFGAQLFHALIVENVYIHKNKYEKYWIPQCGIKNILLHSYTVKNIVWKFRHSYLTINILFCKH